MNIIIIAGAILLTIIGLAFLSVGITAALFDSAHENLDNIS